MSRIIPVILFILFLTSCAPVSAPSAALKVAEIARLGTVPSGFSIADGSRTLAFPQDFGAHEDFRTEWWYYTGNLQTQEGRHFGFELTIFRVGLLPPTVDLPSNSQWYGRSVYFAHFAVSDIADKKFHAYERYSRPGPGLSGAQAEPYRVWLEDWNITEQSPGVYHLQAEQNGISLDLHLRDEMGVILHGQNGYSRKGKSPGNASYYFSQPRLQAEGSVELNGSKYPVNGLAWMDHEFSTMALDPNQIGWDWFSLQFEDGSALMLYQLREQDGKASDASSGTFIDAQKNTQPISKSGFEINVLDQWQSPHTKAIYPSAWEIRLQEPDCLLQARPWMEDQEIHFPAVAYWEGAVRLEGSCDGKNVKGNGYIELTGYGGKLPLP